MRERRIHYSSLAFHLLLCTIIIIIYCSAVHASHNNAGNPGWRGTPPPPPADGYKNPLLDRNQPPSTDTTVDPLLAVQDDHLTTAAEGVPPPPPSWDTNVPHNEMNYRQDDGYHSPGPPPPPPDSQGDFDSTRYGGDDDDDDDDDSYHGKHGHHQPPPPPPSDKSSSQHPRAPIKPIDIDPRDSKYVPIHYNFGKEPEPKAKKGFFFARRRRRKDNDNDTDNDDKDPFARTARMAGDDNEVVPETFSPISGDFEQRRRDEERRRRPGRYEENDDRYGSTDGRDSSRRLREGDDDPIPQYASARRDVITLYQSTATGKLLLTLSCGLAGSIVGAFLGKSILNRPWGLASTFCGIFLFCTLLRNPYGELVRALGMAIILALQRTTSIRRRYPTWRHIKASLGATERRPFPPTTNPWSYQPRRDTDPEFRMLYTVIAMAFVGSTVGGSVPLIPTWIGSLAGAGFFGLSTTMTSSRGDLTRSMGMRVVALCEEMLGINSELQILRKGGVVSGRVLDKVFILDRKHRIKDRLIAGATFAYGQISSQMNRVQSDMNRGDDKDGDDRRGEPSSGRDEPGRGRPRDDDDRRGRPRDEDAWRRGAREDDDRRGRRDDYDDRREPPRKRDDYGDRRGLPPKDDNGRRPR